MTRTGSLDDAVRDLERTVVASVAITARVLAEVAPELTFIQWRVLVVVGEAPEGIAVGAIAAELGARMAATSRLIGRLRTRGLVATTKDTADARVTLVRLTRQGEDLRHAVVERRRTLLAWAVQQGGLTVADAPVAARLARVLERAR